MPTPAREPSADHICLDRMVRAAELVRERLLRSTAALQSASIPYAVVGGLAVAWWVARIDKGATRNTPEVNIIVPRSNMEQAREVLASADFIPRPIPVGYLFLDGPDGSERSAVNLFFAGEKVRAEDLLPTADVCESVQGEQFRVIDLEPLVRMKLTSFRDKDRTHLRDLIGVGLLDSTWPARFIPELAVRLQHILDTPNG